VLETTRRLTYAVWFPRDAVFCYWVGVGWDPTWRFFGLPLIQRRRGTTIRFGKRLVACSDARKNSLGVNQRVILKTTGPGARIEIGDDVGLSGCSVSAAKLIRLGDRVMVGSGCLLTDNDAHPLHPAERGRADATKVAPVVLEEDVFVGARSVVLKGVTIGHGSVIGAGSVVTHDIPAMVVAAGNPARVVRMLEGGTDCR